MRTGVKTNPSPRATGGDLRTRLSAARIDRGDVEVHLRRVPVMVEWAVTVARGTCLAIGRSVARIKPARGQGRNGGPSIVPTGGAEQVLCGNRECVVAKVEPADSVAGSHNARDPIAAGTGDPEIRIYQAPGERFYVVLARVLTVGRDSATGRTAERDRDLYIAGRGRARLKAHHDERAGK